MASTNERQWLELAVHVGFVPAQTVDVATARAAMPAADVALLDALVARSAALRGDGADALGFLTTHTPADAALDETLQSVESSGRDAEVLVTELPGRYATRAELGRGGMGRVVLARDEVTGREVAIKELLPMRGSGPVDSVTSRTVEARFLREARLAAQLEHPAIVPVYELGRRADGSLYYVMRRLPGRSLAQTLAAARTLPERLRLVPHLAVVAHALAYAHTRRVLHRDVKPQNVMLGGFGETYLVDWGLARVQEQPGRTASGEQPTLAPDITAGRLAAVGTPSYMSPEQAAGKDSVDERTDVWGLGAMLYELLTGRPPYVGKSPMDVVAQVLQDDWTPVATLAPDAPADLVAVCARALQKDPARRYATAAAFAADLEAWLAGRQVTARAYSGWELFTRLVKRNKATATVLLGSLVAVLVLGAVSLVRIRAERNEARAFAMMMLNDVTQELFSVSGAEPLMLRVAMPTLAFYERIGGVAAQDEETQLAIARSWGTLGQVMAFDGRLDEADRFAAACDRLVPSRDARLATDVHYAECAISCLNLKLTVARLREHIPPALTAEAVAALGAIRDRWTDDMLLTQERSVLLAALYRTETDPERARVYLDAALAEDRRTFERWPTAGHANAFLVSTLTDEQLLRWDADAPDEALRLGREALAVARRSPRRMQSMALLVAWLSALRQHIMLLKWSDRVAETPALFVEGERVAEQLVSLAPDSPAALGLSADLELERDRPAAAKALLDQVLAGGLRGEYFASWALAAFLAGDDAALLARRAELEQSEDGQVQLMLALALARHGEPSTAAATLRAKAAAISETPLQWPRGCFASTVAATPAPLGPALKAFVASMEVAMPRADGPAKLAALEALAARLDSR